MERFLKGLALTIGLAAVAGLALLGLFYWIPVVAAALIFGIAMLIVRRRYKEPESVGEIKSKKAA